MGMFNNVRFEQPLPDGAVLDDGWLQTKDIEPNDLEYFVVTASGLLLNRHGMIVPFSGAMDLMGSIRNEETGTTTWPYYLAVFEHGRLCEIHAPVWEDSGSIGAAWRAIRERVGEGRMDATREDFLRVAGADFFETHPHWR